MGGRAPGAAPGSPRTPANIGRAPVPSDIPSGGRMRKFAVVATALVAVLGISAVAYAVSNTYRAAAKITPSKSGTFSKPKPVKAGLSFNVGEVANLRPSPLKTYSIGLSPGIVPNTSVAKGCSSAQANSGVLPATCLKKAKSGGANVGSGTVGALIG